MSDTPALLPGSRAGTVTLPEAERMRTALMPTRYIPALDGLRAAAVLLVVASHAAPAHMVPGGFGVTLFFFISGYLLTGQMLDEYLRTGGIDFAGFYLRRMLRLLPAALAFIALSGLFFAAIGGRLPAAAWFSALFHGANYYDIFVGYRPDGVPHPFSILWSLAVEEHFYLVWPLTFLCLLRWGGWRGAAAALAVLCLLELVWRAVLHPLCTAPSPADLCGAAPEIRIYAATDTRFDSLAFGALAAVLVVQSESRRFTMAVGSRGLQVLALILIVGSFAVRDGTFRDVSRYTVLGLAFMIAIPAVLAVDSGLRRLLEARPMVFIGRLSYSIYLWHWLAGMLAAYAAGRSPLVQTPLYLGLTVLLSLAGWYGIERPTLRLRRWAGSATAPEPRLGAA